MKRELFRSRRERRYWVYSALTLAAIIGSAGFAPRLSTSLREFGLLEPLFGGAVLLASAAVLAAGLRWRVNGREAAVLLGILAAYLLLFVRIELVEERSHIVEFGILAVFLREALAERGANRPAMVAFVLTAFAGLADEGIQYALPNRVFDVRDLAFDCLASGMALVAQHILAQVRVSAANRRNGPD